ncbi:hypothetical protein FH972_019787 [Carpinus fangiana]|uniref:Uncharacterized protein n=1 Tax=Carpinus fangiana TaxID=176857 RepID=A0A5N6RRC4_9ROSI|nr:hypothetical protein FH972_019787 [Carpinus fangiana]
MGTSEALALKKDFIKLSSERLEATHGMQSCGLLHNSTPSESDGGKKLDVKYFEQKSSMLRSQKRGAPDLMKYQVVRRQSIDHRLASKCSTAFKQERTYLASSTNGLDDENSCLSSQHTPATTDVAPQGCTIYDLQQSPKKALRAAMKKNQFEETILKA